VGTTTTNNCRVVALKIKLYTRKPLPQEMFGSSLAQSCNSLVPQRPSCETKLPILYSRKHKQFRKFTTRRPNPSFVNKGSLLIKVCLMSSSYLETILRWIRTTSKFVVYRSTGRAMSVHRWTVNRAGVWPWNWIWSSSQWATSLVSFAFDFSSLVPVYFPKFYKNFQDFPSHRIFRRIHEALNINKK